MSCLILKADNYLLTRFHPLQTTPAFVESPLFKDQGVEYFASQVTFDKNGVNKIHDLGQLDASEQKLIDACLPELKKNIEKVSRLMYHVHVFLTDLSSHTHRVSHSLTKTKQSCRSRPYLASCPYDSEQVQMSL